MDRTIDLETARATLDEIMRAAADDGERVIVEQAGHEPVDVARLTDVDAGAAFGRAVEDKAAERARI